MNITYVIWGAVGIIVILLIVWLIVKKATKKTKESEEHKPAEEQSDLGREE